MSTMTTRSVQTGKSLIDKMCSSKQQYETEGKARLAAMLYNMKWYPCPFCYCWHLTSKGKKRTNERS